MAAKNRLINTDTLAPRITRTTATTMQLAHTEPVSPALGLMPHDQGLVYGSVCSGIEAATAAWEPLGWRAAFFAEIEPFPSAVLAQRYPAWPNAAVRCRRCWRPGRSRPSTS